MRREQVITGAIAVLSQHGSRALTHRAVDAAAGLPQGSTSNLFRTRRALIDAIVEALTVADRQALTQLEQHLTDSADLGTILASFVREEATTGATNTRARIALLTDPDADALRHGRATLLEYARVKTHEYGISANDHTIRIVLALVDGLLIDAVLTEHIAHADDIAAAVNAVLASSNTK